MDTSNAFEDQLLSLIRLTTAQIESEIHARVGIRRSARRSLIADLMHRLLLEPAFNREDARSACPGASLKTLDRAIADMEAANLISLCCRNDRKSHGGAVYQFCPPGLWAQRDGAIRKDRAIRSGRGGVRRHL